MPSALPVAIRRAGPGDAVGLAELGATTFAHTFAHTTTPADLAHFIAATYSPARQRAELADAGVLVFVAEDAGATPPLVGYAMLREGVAPPCVSGPAPVELARLYARAGTIGHGVGHRLVEQCRTAARDRGVGTLWLGVWEHNRPAITFYERHGFRDVGAHRFMLGADAQTDRLMECAL